MMGFKGWCNPHRGWRCWHFLWLLHRWWVYGLWPYTAPWAYAPPTVPPEVELPALRAYAQWLKSQLEAIEGRIKELEKEG